MSLCHVLRITLKLLFSFHYLWMSMGVFRWDLTNWISLAQRNLFSSMCWITQWLQQKMPQEFLLKQSSKGSSFITSPTLTCQQPLYWSLLWSHYTLISPKWNLLQVSILIFSLLLFLTAKELLVIAFTVFTVLDPALAGLVWFVSTMNKALIVVCQPHSHKGNPPICGITTNATGLGDYIYVQVLTQMIGTLK